jgi:hypothetical protein
MSASHAWPVARRCVLAAPALLWSGFVALSADVLTQHNDKARTGANLHETFLDTAKVGSGNFGKLWTLYADGQVVAQPLYVAGLRIDTAANQAIPLVQGTFNAVVLATMHNTIYVYDADRERPGPEGRTVPLWAKWLGQPRPGGKDIDMWSTNDPEWGILSTPVISDDKSTLFVAAWHNEGAGGFQYRLHALDLKNGLHRRPPVRIGAPSTDPSACKKQNEFNPCTHKQRPSLLLHDDVLYVGFGGDGNRGALFAFDADDLSQRARWNSTPTGNSGGIWQSGQAPAADAEGNIYLMTGNGTFNANSPGGRNYGSSFVKLKLEGSAFSVKDYFTPCNFHFLNDKDLDLGSAGPLFIAEPPARLVSGGKEGVLYVVSVADMGKLSAGSHAPDCHNGNVVQEIKAFPQVHHHWGNIHGSPVYWKGPDTARIYVWGENNPLKAYKYANGRIAHEPPKQSRYKPPLGMPGGMLSLSAEGNKQGTGIVWALVPLNGDANEQRGVKALLLALDAEDVSRTLWTSEEAGERDQVGLFAKFTSPTIAGGKVFVPTYGDDEPLGRYAGNNRPTQFPKHYYVAVYGDRGGPAPPRTVVNQDRDDVTVALAATAPLSLSTSQCRAIDAGAVDCTDELARVTDRPSFHRVLLAAGENLAGCVLLRVTTASKNAGLANATGIGFWSTRAVAGNQAAENAGRFIAKDKLKATGTATLKNGAPATLHEFVGVANCQTGAEQAARLFKPFMEFERPSDLTLFHNWDMAQNYEISTTELRIDRRGDVLQ